MVAFVAGMLFSCSETKEGNKEEKTTTESKVENEEALLEEKQVSEETPVVVEVDKENSNKAIFDESRKEEGAIQCITEQFELVKAGKTDEAMNYYTADRRRRIEKELLEKPEMLSEWQEVINGIDDEKFARIIEDIRENPWAFQFEDGMWKMKTK